LKNEINLDSETMYRLYSVNRWESNSKIKDMLLQGKNVILDRYIPSGIAFAMANGVEMTKAMEPDRGLCFPDVVLHLNLPVDVRVKRSGFGEERYETTEIQKRAMEAFSDVKSLFSDCWKEIDASGTVEEVFGRVFPLFMGAMRRIDCGNSIRVFDPRK
jgi:dTMP kinase